jgi:hypothetical protein
MDEKPKKHTVSSGTNYWCTECKGEVGGVEFGTYGESILHYQATEHPIIISTYFTSVYGTADQASESNGHPYDY